MNRSIAATLPTALLATVLMNLAAPARAAEFLFGYSGFDKNETLTLSLTGGGTTVLSTDGNQGWWSATFPNSPGNTNYFVGNPLSDSWPAFLRDFFTFDISQLGGQTVTGATLSVTHFTDQSDSGKSSFTYTLHDVSTPAEILGDTEGTSAAIYKDLGTGVLYGSFNVPLSGSSASTLIDSFALNANAVADLNAAIGQERETFSIGGSMPLPAAVPEPAPLSLFASGLLALIMTRQQLKIA
jgi:hypothetical protein